MRRAFALLALVFLAPGLAEAQRPPRPTRPYRGLFGGGPPADPNRTRTELSLTASLLGGYDEGVLTGPAEAGQGSIATTGDLGLDYFIGRLQRSFSTNGRFFVTSYGSRHTDPLMGGDVNMHGVVQLGRRSNMTLFQSFDYAPNLVLGTFGLLESAVEGEPLPDAGDVSGLVEQRSWSSNSSVSIDRQITTRQTLTGTYAYMRRTYLDDAGYDVDGHSVNAGYAWALTRTFSLQGSYDYSKSRYADPTRSSTSTAPMSDHAVQMGFGYTRRLSRTRQIQFSGSVGSSYVDTFNSVNLTRVNYWTPSGSGTVRLDVGRSWAVSADYRRGTNVLQGATLDTFSTNAVSIRADGSIGRRLRTALSTAVSSGRSGVDGAGHFRALSGTWQMQYAFARCCAVSANYDYYSHRLEQVSVPAGLPPDYDRNSIRVGFSLWLPLRGTYGQGEARGTGTQNTR